MSFEKPPSGQAEDTKKEAGEKRSFESLSQNEKVLALLAAAFQPVSKEQVAEWLQVSGDQIQDVFVEQGVIKQDIKGENFYVLSEEKKQEVMNDIDISGAHRMIADAGLKMLGIE